MLIAFQGSPELPIAVEARAGFESAPRTEHFFVITAGASSLEGAESLEQALSDRPTKFDAVVTDEDDTAVILYTSGTTGQAKGAELRHRTMRDNVLACGEIFQLSADTYLGVLPLFHSFGQTVVQNCAIAFGGTIVVVPRFETRTALDLMLAESVSVFAGVPTMYWGLLRALDDRTDVELLAKNIRVALAGGAALPVEIHREFEERFGITILEGYGLSETSPVAIGEIAIRGHNVFKCYLKRPDATREVLGPEGWFRSGDPREVDIVDPFP